MSLTWDEEFGARFKSLSNHEVEVWQEIITQTIHNLHAGEVLAAVQLMGKQKQEGKIKFATVDDLISAIKKNRWLSSSRREGPKTISCVFCGDTGWLSYGASIRMGPEGRQEAFGVTRHMTRPCCWGAYDMSCPCLCSKGAVAMNAYAPEHRAAMQSFSRKAMDWKKSITMASLPGDRRFIIDEG